MNENIETKSTEEQLAATEAHRAQRVAELKSYAGKSFRRKDGKGGIVKVLDYAGVGHRSEIRNGAAVSIREDCFIAHGNGSRWNPPATKFLAEHELTEVTTNETSETII